MTQKAKSSIFIVILSAVLLAIIGCSTGESSYIEPVKEPMTSSVDKVDPDPTPSPTPTPLVDMEEGTYDIGEMPLFAIEGTDYVPFSFGLEQLDSVTADGKTVVNEAEDEQSGSEASGGEGSEESGEEELKDEKAVSSDDESAENPEEEVEEEKIYNTYKIVLKSGLQFRDGTPVTADDVLFNILAHSARGYKGDYDLSRLDIPGMREYHTQIPEEERIRVEKIINAGGFDIEEGKYPEIEGVDTAEQDAIWGCYDEAGLIFAQNIIDYVNSNYALNAYVNAFMSGYLTYAKVEASESLKTAFAYIVWGYGRKKNPYNYRKNTLTTITDKVFDLNEYELTAMDLWEEIKEYYKGDLSDEGINNDVVPGGDPIEKLIADVYFSKQDYRVDGIRGVFKGITREEGSVDERECIYLTLSDKDDIGSFNFFLTEPMEFERTGSLNDPEVIVEIEEEESEEEGEGSEGGEGSEENSRDGEES